MALVQLGKYKGKEQVSHQSTESGTKSFSKSKNHILNDKGSISQWRYNCYEYATKKIVSIFKTQNSWDS
jgi:hypothetical protein